MRDESAHIRHNGSSFCDLTGAHAVLPCQFFDPVRERKSLQAERRLMLAVLEDAINCLQIRKRRHGIKKELYEETVDWLKSEDDEDVFSFQNICEVLDIDASKLRSKLLRRIGEKRSRPSSGPERSALRADGREYGPKI